MVQIKAGLDGGADRHSETGGVLRLGWWRSATNFGEGSFCWLQQAALTVVEHSGTGTTTKDCISVLVVAEQTVGALRGVAGRRSTGSRRQPPLSRTGVYLQIRTCRVTAKSHALLMGIVLRNGRSTTPHCSQPRFVHAQPRGASLHRLIPPTCSCSRGLKRRYWCSSSKAILISQELTMG